MIKNVIKRDGQVVFCDGQKIETAITKAVMASGETGINARALTEEVLDMANARESSSIQVEEIQDLVEKVLISHGYASTAKVYILYREQRKKIRDGHAVIDATTRLFKDYLDDKDWRINENANTCKSVNGMNNYIREEFTKQYWLNEVYPAQIREAHTSGHFHLHDLGFFGPYCAGWDIAQLLQMGFGGIPGKVSSKPAKHLRSFLGQIVNSTFSTQGETAGAQAWSSIDTYCAPFIRYDKMDFTSVKQALQEFIFNLNVPTRVGFQCPFSNLTFDLRVPRTLKDKYIMIGGEYKNEVYGDFQPEMDIFNLAFCSIMMEGDAAGRVFTFPIPTINVTKDFKWDGPVVDAIMEMTCKYGIPYFSNYINSDLSPEDALSMCCRLRLNTKELRKRGGGLFGSNPLTGSVGVVTLNLPRFAFESRDENEFFEKIRQYTELAKQSLELKREVIEKETERGMYPFSARYLEGIKKRFGSYWINHFSTIGIIGMNEACQNLLGKDKNLTTEEGQALALKTLNFMRDIITAFQAETGHYYNLEATPAEGTSYRLAKIDKENCPGIITAGTDAPYYTNSSQLPVSFTDDIFETIDLQDELQCCYTGGTVLHLYLGERVSDIETAKKLIKKIFETYKLPYISLTPTFSTCEDHGYLVGEQETCPICGKATEVWTRVVGYLRPVKNFNKGKQEEFKERQVYHIKAAQL
ncbi:MAG: ribonucleoside triphosphate reductase [Sphaerochaetaceae bacterium]